MSEQAPRTFEMNVNLAALGTDVEGTVVAGKAAEDGFLNAATYAPVANVTGAATNKRTLQVINKGQDGNGATVMATLDYDTGISSTDYNETPFVLSVVADAREVVEGDVIAVASTAPGTGIADPGGQVFLGFGRQQS